jgi:hypothetical protein
VRQPVRALVWASAPVVWVPTRLRWMHGRSEGRARSGAKCSGPARGAEAAGSGAYDRAGAAFCSVDDAVLAVGAAVYVTAVCNSR